MKSPSFTFVASKKSADFARRNEKQLGLCEMRSLGITKARSYNLRARIRIQIVVLPTCSRTVHLSSNVNVLVQVLSLRSHK